MVKSESAQLKMQQGASPLHAGKLRFQTSTQNTLTVFPQQKWLRERASKLRDTYIVYLATFKRFINILKSISFAIYLLSVTEHHVITLQTVQEKVQRKKQFWGKNKHKEGYVQCNIFIFCGKT
jgi:hypothetical protein